MANPDYVDTASVESRSAQRYNAVAVAEPVHSQPATSFHAHVRHPFPFSTAAGPMPPFAFPRPGDYHRPVVTGAGGSLANAYDGGFNPSPFGQQFSGEMSSDRTGPPAGNLYRPNVDAVRPGAVLFDSFSGLFRAMSPMSAASSSKFYPSCAPVGYTTPASGFMSQADGGGFVGGQLQSSSQPWPPPTFGQLSRLPPPAPGESLVDELHSGSMLQNSAVGSDSVSSGSPVTELLDHRANSPITQSVSDLVKSARRSFAVSSPFCPSPVDSVQLSRSLPTGVRLGGSQAGSAAVGHYPATFGRHYDSMSRRSFIQPGTVLDSGPDDRTTASAGFQVGYRHELHTFQASTENISISGVSRPRRIMIVAILHH